MGDKVNRRLKRFFSELVLAWTIAMKDIKVYYFKPGMVMFGFLMPFFMFFSFSVRRHIEPSGGIARLLALSVFFTAAAAGPIIIPLERRLGTYDRLRAAPMSLLTLLLGKTSVGAIFALSVSAVALFAGVLFFHASIANPFLLVVGLVIGSFSFATMGLIFGSIPTRNPGSVQMPSTLMRWGLLFISGVFIPLSDMGGVAYTVAHLSPLTYFQDLMNNAILGVGLFSPLMDSAVLVGCGILFLVPSVLMHNRSRRMGY